MLRFCHPERSVGYTQKILLNFSGPVGSRFGKFVGGTPNFIFTWITTLRTTITLRSLSIVLVRDDTHLGGAYTRSAGGVRVFFVF